MRFYGARPTMMVPELELVRDGPDQAATMPDVEELYARYADRVFRWALRFGGGDVAWAEDVTQDVFVNLVKRTPELEDAGDLGGWFYRVTVNRCLNELRRRRVVAAISSVLSAWVAEPDRRRTPETVVMARSELEAAIDAIRCLPPVQRVAFCMHHLDGLAQQEIGQILGYSKGYVSRLLKRAGERLRGAGWRVEDE
jgi:RNA polymerase sigma-70 factor, ECF subfamily